MNTQGAPFYGKYRGTVVTTQDPEMMGRIRAVVPSVLGDQVSAWAVPSVPYAGLGVGFLFLPPDGSSVWIEFEGGDSDLPIWTGSFWPTPGEAPPVQAENTPGMLRAGNATILFSNSPTLGGLTLETAAGARITLNDHAITITNGQGASIELAGPNVIVNGHPL